MLNSQAMRANTRIRESRSKNREGKVDTRARNMMIVPQKATRKNIPDLDINK